MQINLSARLARRAWRRIIASMRYGSLARSPICFANSFPKSGTHLLTQVLQGFTRLGPVVDSGLAAVVTFDGFSGRQRAAPEILADLKRLLPGDIAYGHVHAIPETISLLSGSGFATFFILRDPRDVVVSHVHYIAEMAPNHIHHRYYHQVLQDFNERLEASIAGVPVEKLSLAGSRTSSEPLPDIRQRFEPYLGWLDAPQVLVLRYEDFLQNRIATLANILDHVEARGFQIQCKRSQALEILIASIDPQRSPTFRSGKIGNWRKDFTENHLKLFARVTGDLLQHLGYEDDGRV